MAIDNSAKSIEGGAAFTAIPILSLAEARSPDTKPKFLAELREALLNVGFLYLDNTGVPKELIDQVCQETSRFFDETFMPLEEKEKIEMKNEKSFLGWSRVSHPPDFMYVAVEAGIWFQLRYQNTSWGMYDWPFSRPY
jgi:hypothetical protein